MLVSSGTGLLGPDWDCGFTDVTSAVADACLSSVPLLLLGPGPKCVLLAAFMHGLPLVLSAVLMDKPSRVGKTSNGLYVPGGLVPDKIGNYNSNYGKGQ
jgi:hypothetical protein